MNNKIANILKGYVSTLSWADKVSGLVHVAHIRKKTETGGTEKSYPVSCDIDADACVNGRYQDLVPDSKKKSIMYFEDRGGVQLEKHEGNQLFYRAQLRLIGWINLILIEGVSCESDVSNCGVSGDYVIDVLKCLPYLAFDFGRLYGIQIEPPSQVERSVDIFSRYTYNETATQYLMFPYDYFALDINVSFIIPCVDDRGNI